jgi:type III pantothenate kinase
MPDLVVDVGNTRMKWGLVDSAARLIQTTALPLDDESSWLRQVDSWSVARGTRWTLAATHPSYRNLLAGWIKQRGDSVRIIDDYRQLPLKVRVDQPEQVGIDRLLNAIAILPKAPRGGPIVIVNAGSAVTVDLVDVDGVFRGGAIFPGFRLMARALNDYTAKLPRIELFGADAPLPGTNTIAAIEAGIGNAIRGGVLRIVDRYAESFGKPRVYIAGGDAELLADLKSEAEMAGPFLTLEGIRIAARELS